MVFEKLMKMKLVVFKDCGVHCYDADKAPRGIATFWNPRMIQGSVVVSSLNHIAPIFILIIVGIPERFFGLLW